MILLREKTFVSSIGTREEELEPALVLGGTYVDIKYVNIKGTFVTF